MLVHAASSSAARSANVPETPGGCDLDNRRGHTVSLLPLSRRRNHQVFLRQRRECRRHRFRSRPTGGNGTIAGGPVCWRYPRAPRQIYAAVPSAPPPVPIDGGGRCCCCSCCCGRVCCSFSNATAPPPSPIDGGGRCCCSGRTYRSGSTTRVLPPAPIDSGGWCEGGEDTTAPSASPCRRLPHEGAAVVPEGSVRIEKIVTAETSRKLCAVDEWSCPVLR